MRDFVDGPHEFLLVAEFVEVVVTQKYPHIFDGNRTNTMSAGQDPSRRNDGSAANMAKFILTFPQNRNLKITIALQNYFFVNKTENDSQ